MKPRRTMGQKKIVAASMPEAAAFWGQELSGAIPSAYPTDFYRTMEPGAAPQYAEASAKLDAGLLDKLSAAFGTNVQDRGEALASAVLALVYVAYNGVAQDLTVQYAAESETGSFQLPLRLNLADESTFAAVLHGVREYIGRAHAHKNYPTDLIMPQHHIVIDVAPLREEASRRTAMEATLTFEFAVNPGSGDVKLTVIGDASRYLEASVQQLADKVCLLIERCAEAPQANLLQLELRSAYDQDLSRALNATSYPFSDQMSLVDLFERTFQAQGADLAIRSREGDLTYKELDRKSKQIASHLLASGDQGGEPVVGIMVDRSPDFLIGVLGIMRAGKAYVPLDPKAPEERNHRILSQSGAAIVLCAERYRDKLPASVACYAIESIDGTAALEQLPAVAPEALAYVIFTSGSTGLPKGVCVNHRSAVNRLEWMQRRFPLQQDDVILHKTPSTFDVSVWELFWWQIAGCQAALLPPGEEANPEVIIETIERNSVTTMHFVPSMLNAFLDYVELTGSAGRLQSLSRVFCSGEALSPHHVEKFYKLLGNVSLINLYGPTEATVDVTCHIARKGDNPVPIGEPIDNIRLYIVDDRGQERPTGMVGELCIAGVGVANGYINDPSRTAERFVAMPSLGEAVVYKTGDLARVRHDKTIEYLGRNDRQVKVRGFRIELGEIEHALTSQSYLNDAVVLSHGESDGMYHLYAYVIAADKTVTYKQIVSDLALIVPSYMIPDNVYLIERMPLTPNGKVDRNALLSLRELEARPEKVLPVTPEEQRMARIWEQVLGLDEVGVTDNFFALGGNSINFVSVLALASEKGMKISYQQLFKHPTIRELLNPDGEIVSDEALLDQIDAFALISEEDRSRVPEGIEDAYPMSMLQAGLVYQSIVMQGDNNYHDIVSYTIAGAIDVDVFREAVRRLVTEQPIFRTSYNLRDFSQYMQLVHRELDKLPLNVHDLRGLKTQEEQDQWYEEWFWKEQHRPFEWETPGLVQLHIHILRDDSYRYSISQHNSGLDGWSMNKVHTYLFQTYFDLISATNERTVTISGNDHNRNFIYLEQRAIKSEQHRKFWADLLQDAPDGVIPRSRQPKPKQGNEVVFHDVALPEGLSASLVKLANELKVPVKDVLLASHIKFLSLLNDSPDVFIGYEIGGRPERAGAEDALGVFLNTMPFRVKLNEQHSWREMIRSVYDVEAQVLPFRRYPMAKVMQDQGTIGMLFETVFNFTHFYSLKAIRDLPGFDRIDVRAAAITEFPLRIEYSRHFYDDQVELSLHYHTAAFDEADMRNFGHIFVRILEAMVERTDERHHDLAVGDHLERYTIVPAAEVQQGEGQHQQKEETAESIEQAGYAEAVERVRSVWSSVLGIPADDLKLQDDFFLIGGNSLSAMKVSLLMEKQLSLKTIMQKSVLHELASALLTNGAKPVESTNVLQCLSKSATAAQTIVFIPYAGGNALSFMPVAKAFEAIDADVSVYAVELPGHDPNAAAGSLKDFAAVAKLIVDEIELKLGNSEFVIWGHCVGTALAYEVTRQLEARSRAPKKLFLAAKVLAQPGEIEETIENAKRLVFGDIAKFHAEWSGTNELSTLGETYERHLVNIFRHDSIESNQYLLSLWNQSGAAALQTPTVAVVTKDDPATQTYASEWSAWSRFAPELKLQTFELGGHYFFRTIQREIAGYLLGEMDSKRQAIPSH
ncbi:amino acid adenylation domain-containing protein [Paenibacillus phyllosphaerae]|uniref:Amino acid adenylation domain-containing protein n=1 Tax=Paenibacillus phyllosphaerae TaxID=274593 RepID=A0A7W5FPH4_9BACL|nr:non-ribosomal peptide synthetase [Paenibacillus phyllosphaerae]MBB3112258.1 amino acid adenylation domain-containing protein [Paenibacillus phyllosphaerae]